MRRRHKAQYAAHERAHLAPSMPHVRRDRCLPGAHPKPSATHPAASEERTKLTHERSRNEEDELLQLPGEYE
ncbi:hypothetical protein E3U43_011011 [Larimichthys crocea]|uniref:Uncharacterized protein n=1 Tax=Larimichthys crocea TaxID=215358 RepID=A0ACD3RH37_LARCR|nr:hypothetical protein E3U43_011011 [Larimichthys crocea]